MSGITHPCNIPDLRIGIGKRVVVGFSQLHQPNAIQYQPQYGCYDCTQFPRALFRPGKLPCGESCAAIQPSENSQLEAAVECREPMERDFSSRSRSALHSRWIERISRMITVIITY